MSKTLQQLNKNIFIIPATFPLIWHSAIQAHVKLGPDNTGRVNQILEKFQSQFLAVVVYVVQLNHFEKMKKCIQASGIKG